MALTSIAFFSFFLLSLLIYYMIPGKYQWCGLLLFSLCFFLVSAVPYTVFYLLISILVTFFCTRSMGKSGKNNAKAALAVGVIINIGLLGLLKYSNFFSQNFNVFFSVLHLPVRLPKLDLPAPLGISYYTLSVLGYLLDCYWGTVSPQTSLMKTALFVSYYPQLTSGPVVRYQQVSPELYRRHQFDYQAVTFGLQRMLWGIFKKLVLSARLGILVDTIYGDPSSYQGLYVWMAAGLFVLQLYTDFSGCIDIIMGVSECYGIKLPENFRTPLFSRSVQEFWQRWHITLGAWMRDYILYSVLRSALCRKLAQWVKPRWGKKAARQIPAYLGMLCVWLLMGLWHGGSWKYVIGVGCWFWVLIVLSQTLEPLSNKIIQSLHINTGCFSWHLFQSLRVFVLVSFGTMFLRLDGLLTTLRTMKLGLSCWNPEIFFDGSLFQLGLDRPDFWVAVFGLGLLLLVSVMQEKGSVREWLARQNLVFRWVVLFALIFGIVFMGSYGPGYDAQSFIYEQF